MAEIKLSSQVAEIVQDLIDKYHPHVRENGVRILCCYSDQDKATRGRPVRAEIVSLGGRAKWLSGFVDVTGEEPNEGYDFCLTAFGSIWEGMTYQMRQAAIDAELCKLVEKTVQTRDGETTTIKLQDYDVKGFVANIERFGLWASSLRIFASKAKQLPLDLTEGEARGEEGGIGESQGTTEETDIDVRPELVAVK